MTIQENKRQSKYSPSSYAKEKAHITMYLVKQIKFSLLSSLEIKRWDRAKISTKNLKTFKFYGKAVLVGFVPVNIENFDNVIKIFNMDVNEYLNRYTKGNDLSLDEMFG